MVLENYGQVDYDELDVVDVDGVDEEILEDIEEDLLDDVEESEEEDVEEEEQEEDDEEEQEQELIDSTPEKPKPLEDSSRKRVRDRSKRTRDDGEGSSGEEAWLKALESGKLEEVMEP